VLDAARFLFGEAGTLVAHTHRVRSDIRGEDAATVLLGMASGASVLVTMSYASRLEEERFPQTFITVEGEDASVELTTDYWLKVTTRAGTEARRVPPPWHPWADSRYEVVHASIPACQADLLAHLRGEKQAETTAADNLRTLRLVDAAYASAAAGGERVRLDSAAV
jgi:predicted dehydrogenase